MGVVNLPSGQPTLRLTGGAAARLAAMTPAGHGGALALTMTDEYPYAFAQVIISAAVRGVRQPAGCLTAAGLTRMGFDPRANHPHRNPTLSHCMAKRKSGGSLENVKTLSSMRV